MGYEFDDNGIYVGWSPFFNYSSLESLTKSEELPTPNGKTYAYSDSETALDITSYLMRLNKDNFYTVEALPVLVDMLLAIDNNNSTELTYDSSLTQDDNANFILNRINEHNLYMDLKFDKNGRVTKQKGQAKIYAKNIIGAFKNSAASKISRIIQNVKNVNSAYTPINMDDPQAAASKSALGKEATRITATSPSSKWIMTVQNMSGKQVIGITAVGEKIFFAACNYFNECVASGDAGWFNKAFFQNVINKVQSMTDKNGNKVMDKNGDPITITSMRNIIANVNFNWNPDQKLKWEALIKQVMTTENKPVEEIARTLREQLGLQADQSLVISALLSAATDNAKELILDKINAGPALAGMYLHLIMLNYSFEDIANFMTSPTVQIIKDLAKTNIFDDYHDSASGIIDQVCNSLETGPNINKYLNQGEINTILYRAKEQGLIKKDWQWKDYYKYLAENFVQGAPLTTNIFPASTAQAFRYMEEYNFLQAQRAKLDTDMFTAFRQIKEDAKETTMLGQGLSINQGLKTDIAGKLAFLDKLENVIKNAEKDYPISDMDDFVSIVMGNKRYLSPEYISDAYTRAKEEGIIGNFEIEKFLDPKNKSYREATFDYHNCIKKVWPFFDMIDKVPHYKALYEVLYLTELSDSKMSNKYRLIKELKKRLINEKDHSTFFDQDTLKALASAVDEILITNWLSKEGIIFKVKKEQSYFDRNGLKNTVKQETETFNLATDEGRATFKLWMETVIVPELKKGLVDGKKTRDTRKIRTNAFIRRLQKARRTDSFTRDYVNYLKLPIDMLNIKTESDEANFDNYKKGLSELKSVYVQGRPLTDWLFLYNLIVNKNMFGSDRLTTIFSDILREDDSSIILKYQKLVGDSDYLGRLELDGFNLDDLLIKLAPIVPKNQIYRAKDQYIRVYNPETERYDILEKQTQQIDPEFMDYAEEQDQRYRGYKVIDSNKSLKDTRDYYNYFLLRTPKQSQWIRQLSFSQNDDLDDTMNKIRSLMSRNTIDIDINCE